MKTINNDGLLEIGVQIEDNIIAIGQGDDDFGYESITITKQGADELIKVLQEWVDDENNQ